MPVNLTRNAIATINAGDVNSKPLVQVVDIKLIGNSQERYRFLLSDSESTQHAMLATQLNELVRTGRVKKGSIIQLIDYICSTVQNCRIIVVLNMETIIPEYEIIGKPKALMESDSATNKLMPSNNLEPSVRSSNNRVFCSGNLALVTKMPVNLTRNTIALINAGDVNSKPLVQVVDIKLIGNSQERYQFLLSDSESTQHAIFATQLNELVRTGRVKKGSIIQLIDYICSTVQNHRIIVVLNMETIIPEYEIIGKPKVLMESDSATNKLMPNNNLEPSVRSGNNRVFCSGNLALVTKMPVNLTRNAITSINAGDVNSKPLVQVVDIKLIGNSQERYRFLLSDSESTQHAILATQLNELVRTGRVKKGSIILLIDYICSTVQNHRIIVVLNMETIIPEYEIIRKPKVLMESDSATNKLMPNNNLEPSVRSSNNRYSAQVPANNVQSFQPTIQPAYQPPPNYRIQGPIMKNEAPAHIIPIASLNPYQGRWAIKARVTAKGDLRRYNNARGDGKVFSFDVLDSNGGEIRVTCFNAVFDRFYDVIEVGKVYLISKGSLKPAKKNFNHLKNEWEIFLESNSTVELCPNEDDSIPRQQFSFRPISEIESAENNFILDVIGIVITVNPSVPILRKNGMETQRRILNLKDASGKSVELTLWGDFCNKEGQKLQEMVDSGFFPVLAVKAGKINDFNGKSIGTISSTQLFIDPDCPEAQGLRGWFERGGRNTTSISISKEIIPGGSKNEIRKSLFQIKDEGLGRSDKPDWITARATVVFIKMDNFCYTACPLMIGDGQCNKKVTQLGNKRWLCDHCNQEFEECDYRYLLQVQIQDHTGLTWVTAFQESGEEILGCSAKEMYLMKYELQDDTRFGEIIHSRLFYQYLFRLKIKEELYGDELRVKITIVKVDKVNYSAESRYLLDLITKNLQIKKQF